MITYRKANTTDINSIARLHAESWRFNYRGILDDHFLDNEVLENRKQVWSERMYSGDIFMKIILAEDGNLLIGFGCLYLNHDTEYGALLDNLHVSKSYSGKGIGTHIIQVFAAEIFNSGKRKDMYLWVLEENTRAIRLYEKLKGQEKGMALETGLGSKQVPKYRYYWPSVDILINDV